MRISALFIVAGLLITWAIACGGGDEAPGGAGSSEPASGSSSGLPQGNQPFELRAGDEVAGIDNPYWPMKPGNRWVFNETDADGNRMQVEVVVTKDEKEILGIRATVVHDVVRQDGQVVEDTFDWYAQDADGNIWYMGEATKEYKNRKVASTEGSWEAGVDGALAGIAMPAHPAAGMMYRQEYYESEAEDQGKVLSLDEHVEVPYGTFNGCLQTEDTSAIEPDVRENKYYCRGVGPVLAVDVASGEGREELVTFEEGTQQGG